MNDPNALRPMTIETALSALAGASYDVADTCVSDRVPVRSMSLGNIQFRQIGVDRDPPGFESASVRQLGGLAREASMPEIAGDAITRITRITSQAGLGWGIRTAHAHLAATERTWNDASPSTVRLAGENAAPTTGGVADPGELSVGKDP